LAKKKTDPAKAVDKQEEKKEETVEYTYNPVGKPDPFKPFVQLSGGREFAKNVPLTPLQKYEISQLKLVAVIINPQGNIALVEDSSGKGYFLKKGTSVGKNEGRVTRILKDRVIVQEVHEDIAGQRKVNEIPLILHRLEEGGES
jgi:type IV pilus assembly protein PilP